MKTKKYMNITPLGYRLRMGYIPNSVNGRSKVGFVDGIWKESKKLIHKKLKEALHDRYESY
jgi:hypothetical protein